jgi:Domain of unknown function (DUF1874)
VVQEFQQAGATIISAIGHQPTADFLTTILEFPVPTNRITFQQSTTDLVLVFKLMERPPEGQIFNQTELAGTKFTFGLLSKVSDTAEASTDADRRL